MTMRNDETACIKTMTQQELDAELDRQYRRLSELRSKKTDKAGIDFVLLSKALFDREIEGQIRAYGPLAVLRQFVHVLYLLRHNVAPGVYWKLNALMADLHRVLMSRLDDDELNCGLRGDVG